jgi:hypothetical protein
VILLTFPLRRPRHHFQLGLQWAESDIDGAWGRRDRDDGIHMTDWFPAGARTPVDSLSVPCQFPVTDPLPRILPDERGEEAESTFRILSIFALAVRVPQCRQSQNCHTFWKTVIINLALVATLHFRFGPCDVSSFGYLPDSCDASPCSLRARLGFTAFRSSPSGIQRLLGADAMVS